MTVLPTPVKSAWPNPDTATALARIRDEAAARDRDPAFPADAFALLREAGALSFTVPGPDGARPVSYGTEWDAVRAVAAADASVRVQREPRRWRPPPGIPACGYTSSRVRGWAWAELAAWEWRPPARVWPAWAVLMA